MNPKIVEIKGHKILMIDVTDDDTVAELWHRLNVDITTIDQDDCITKIKVDSAYLGLVWDSLDKEGTERGICE